MTLRIWARPTLLFCVAYALNVTPHEFAHAAATSILGFRATAFQLWVDSETPGATNSQIVIIAAAGPLFSICLGAVASAMYYRSTQRPGGLLWLYLAAAGLATGAGNVMGAALGGDGHTIATRLGIDRGGQLAASALGAFMLVGVMIWQGRELVKWAPRTVSRTHAVLCVALVPFVAGTALTLLAYAPLPRVLISAHLSELGFSMVAVAAAAVARTRSTSPAVPIVTSDWMLAFITLGVVRLLALGIRLPAI